MRRVYDEEIASLHRQFSQMGNRVNEAIYKAVKAFVKHDKELAKSVIDNDIKINEMEQDLEQSCIELIALQQPVTSDLRKIVTIMKASADLERMGDHAVSISKSTIRVKGSKRNTDIEDKLNKVGDKIKNMGHEILDAFIAYDDKLALEVAKKDELIDSLTTEIKRDSIRQMEKDPELVQGATDYLMTAAYLERIGDYITNIAEWIVYFRTGEIKELNTQNTYDDLETN